MSDIFRGSITQAVSLYSSYEPRSAVKLQVAGEVNFTRDFEWLAPELGWETFWEAFDETGKLIGHEHRKHSIAPWTTVDTGYDTFTLPCGVAPSSSFNLRLKLSARIGPWKPYSFVADTYILIPVMGSAVTPPPIPAPPYTPYPAPAPKPSPTPRPIAPAPIVSPKPPAPTPSPISFPGLPGENKWLLPVLIGGVALLILLPGKKGK